MDAPHPGIETAMLVDRDAAKRALIHARVFWRHPSGVQYAAIVTEAFGAGVVNLLVLGTYGIELDADHKPGEPAAFLSVPHGADRLYWQTEIDT